MYNKLAIIGASYLQLPLILKAQSLGYETHVFAWKAEDVGERAADFFHPVSITEKEKILEECIKLDVCGICSIASDLASITVNYVANAMNLCGNSMACTKKSTNKYEMRKAFWTAGDPVPESIEVDRTMHVKRLPFDYPVIVKPTDRSGSRGICKVNNPAELDNAVKKALDISFEKRALIEQYIDGREYSVEYISYKGRHHFLALTRKYTTGAPFFIETRHVEPADVSCACLDHIRAIVEHALNTLEITNGASHSEIRIDDHGTIKIIEIGARMGGDCIGSDLVMYSTGIDYVRAVIQVACGQEPDLAPVQKKIKAESVYMFSQKDVDEWQRLKKFKPECILRDVYYTPEALGKTTDSSNRVGCYIRKVINE